ncbi:MAG: MFS transporter [Myxococcales bacterium]
MSLVRLLFWTHLVSSVAVPFFRDWGGLDYTTILLVQAWFMVWSFVLEVPTGAVADRFGRRVSLAAGAFVAAAGSLLYASAPLLPVFLLGEIVLAAAFVLVSGADEALVYDTLRALGREPEATHVIARLESYKLAGILVGALAGGVVASTLGVRAPMLVQAVPAALAGFVALTLVEPPSDAPAGHHRHGYFRVLTSGLYYFRASSQLRRLTLDLVANGAFAWMVLWLYQPQLQRGAVPLSLFGVVHAVMSLCQIALLARVESAERLLGGRLRLIRVGALVPPLCFLALGLTANPAASVALVVVAATFGLSRPPVFSGALNQQIPSSERATVLSAVSAVRTLGLAVFYPLAGALMDRSLPLAFVVLGALGLATAVLSAAPGAAFEPTPPEGASEAAEPER